jgi:predicted nucleic acid-binding protein
VALQNKNDHYHHWAVDALAKVAPPLLTCEAVISETCFLLRDFKKSDVLFQWLRNGAIQIAFYLPNHAQAVQSLMAKYANIPMLYADACLLRMAEIHTSSSIFTVDSDFRIYRKHGNEPLTLIYPDTQE